MASRQQEKSEQTRMELKESAYKLFLEKGYDGTTIAEITNNAGYATGSFYRHWKEKEELLQIIQDEFIEKVISLNQQILEEITSLEEIVDCLVNIFLELTENRVTLRLFVESPQSMRNEQFYIKMNNLISSCTNLLARKIHSLANGKKTELTSVHSANLIYSFLSGYILLNSIDIAVPPTETLRSALLVILKADLS